MKIQKVVRTRPEKEGDGHANGCGTLNFYLANGYHVVLSNPYDYYGNEGIEYIIEKEEERL